MALKHIGASISLTLLWVDALCINQEDNAERARQVKLMGEIYSTAQKVLVWLDPSENDSDLVMDSETIVALCIAYSLHMSNQEAAI